MARHFFASREELEHLYTDQYMTQAEIAKKFGVSQKKVWGLMHYYGMETRAAIARFQSRELSHWWKGGRYTRPTRDDKPYRGKGYTALYEPEQPNANTKGYVFEHIAVALAVAGLEKIDSSKHCVHHINFNRTDNHPDNLVICTHEKHRRYHGDLEELTAELLARGIVAFDAEKGYVVNDHV